MHAVHVNSFKNNLQVQFSHFNQGKSWFILVLKIIKKKISPVFIGDGFLCVVLYYRLYVQETFAMKRPGTVNRCLSNSLMTAYSSVMTLLLMSASSSVYIAWCVCVYIAACNATLWLCLVIVSMHVLCTCVFAYIL